MNVNELMEKAVKFHGHSCPGLAIGVLVSTYIMENDNDFSVDEELVAIVENNNCSVDALQALLGTTFGKGNLVFRDYGKNNFTIYNRTGRKGVRLSARTGVFGSKELSKEDRTKFLLESDVEKIFSIEGVDFDPPEYAEIHESIKCSSCGEATMSTRIWEIDNDKLCTPCYEKTLLNS